MTTITSPSNLFNDNAVDDDHERDATLAPIMGPDEGDEEDDDAEPAPWGQSGRRWARTSPSGTTGATSSKGMSSFMFQTVLNRLD